MLPCDYKGCLDNFANRLSELKEGTGTIRLYCPYSWEDGIRDLLNDLRRDYKEYSIRYKDRMGNDIMLEVTKL